MTRLEAAQAAYMVAFKLPPPEPFGVNDKTITEALEQAIAQGQPLGDDYDWWAELPPDAVA